MLKVQEVGRHLVGGFAGTTVTDELRELVQKLGAGGVILFSRNYESPEQLAELTRAIREMAGDRRIFIGVDQEGGRVARLKGDFTEWPPMRALGAIGDAALAESLGNALATELSAVGIDWVFAPVLDVDSNPNNPVIGDRAFSSDPEMVVKIGLAVASGIQSAGVMACGKHFPGHGDTDDDSHKVLPVVTAKLDRLMEREYVPFREAVNTQIASIMTAHVIYPVMDLAHPATTSRVIVEGQLRRAMSYEGLVITDDMEMAAIADRYDPIDAAMMSFYAGADFLLACHTLETQEMIVKSLFDARLSNVLPIESFHASEKRIDATANRFPVPRAGDFSVIGCEEHRKLAEMIADRASN
jgi:beta-N-acetylhexosaminidase